MSHQAEPSAPARSVKRRRVPADPDPPPSSSESSECSDCAEKGETIRDLKRRAEDFEWEISNLDGEKGELQDIIAATWEAMGISADVEVDSTLDCRVEELVAEVRAQRRAVRRERVMRVVTAWIPVDELAELVASYDVHPDDERGNADKPPRDDA